MDRSRLIRIHDCKLSGDGRIVPPIDDFSSRVLDNLRISCSLYDREEVIRETPYAPDSKLPFHNLYLAFYAGAFSVAMILQYGIAYAITKEEQYGVKGKEWLLATTGWEVSQHSFYSVSRLIHAVLAGVEWLEELLSDGEIEQVYQFVRRLCLHHEPQALAVCASKEVGGHPSLYASGFGLASLALAKAGLEPQAQGWLEAVLHKFRLSLLPDEVSADGTYQPDGNWSIEYPFRYKFIFLDALRLTTGEDLIAAHREDMLRPLRYLKHAFMGDGRVPLRDRYEANGNMLGGYQIDTYGSLFLRYASLTGDGHLQWIGTRNPAAGRTNAYGYKVKGGHRFLYPVGYSDYLWYDPAVKPVFQPPAELAKLFPDGELAMLRTDYAGGLTLAYQGRRGNVMYESPDLVVNKNGRSMFCAAPVADSLPLAEANGPAAGGEMERKGVIRKLEANGKTQVLQIEGFRTAQRITVDPGRPDAVEITVTRRDRSRREVSLQAEPDGQYLRLRGEGYLQYDRRKNFNPNQGWLELEFRLSRKPSRSERHPAVLFSIGQHLKYMFGHAMFVGFLEDGRLGVKFKDSEGRWLFAHLSGELPAVEPGHWHKLAVYWKNLNRANATPVCGIVFGEYRAEARLAMPDGKPFHCKPKTSMWVGGGVQMPDSFAQADIRGLKIYGKCPIGEKFGNMPAARELLFATDYNRGMEAVYAKGIGKEQAESGLEYRFHAQADEDSRIIVRKDGVQVVRGGESVYVTGQDVEIQTEALPFLRSGFAGQSFEDEGEAPLTHRIIVRPRHGHDRLSFQIRTDDPSEGASQT